jgi:hypothetical protein
MRLRREAETAEEIGDDDRIVELRRGILKKNDELAAGLRERYTAAAGVLVLNLVSSPGTGKTAFLGADAAGVAGARVEGGGAGGRFRDG